MRRVVAACVLAAICGLDAAFVVCRQDHGRREGQGQDSHRHVRRRYDVHGEASQTRLQETRWREELTRMSWRDGLIRSWSDVATSRSAVAAALTP